MDLPAFVRATVTEQPGRYNVNLIAYAPEKRGEITVVEDAAAVVGGHFKVLTGDRKVKSVVLAPEGSPVDFSVEDGYADIRMPVFKGYAMAVIEFA